MPFPADWSAGPVEPKLGAGVVHVWRLRLGPSPGSRLAFERILSPDELERAARFKFERDRAAFLARRGILRRLAAGYLGCLPKEVSFRYDRYGKPWVSELESGGPIQFNLSHSAGWALYAFCAQHLVGVDIERRRADFDLPGIARRFFSPAEQSELFALPEPQRPQGFYNCWTCKEAFIKAHGEGLSLPLDQFDVSLAPGAPARLLATRGDLEPAGEWTLLDFEPAAGYSAALAVHGRELDVHFFETFVDADPRERLTPESPGLEKE